MLNFSIALSLQIYVILLKEILGGGNFYFCKLILHAFVVCRCESNFISSTFQRKKVELLSSLRRQRLCRLSFRLRGEVTVIFVNYLHKQ
jgi:hypothetical protein